MVFRPVIHLIVLVVIALVAATFVFLSARRSLRTNLMDVIRRSLIAVVVIIMGAGPSIPGTIIEVTSNIEVYFVIDRTGSMGAEDWDGENPRIDASATMLPHSWVSSRARGTRFCRGIRACTRTCR